MGVTRAGGTRDGPFKRRPTRDDVRQAMSGGAATRIQPQEPVSPGAGGDHTMPGHAGPGTVGNGPPQPQGSRAASPHDRTGEILGGTYRIERHIADGGMGSVYEVVHTRLQQRFAIKVMERSFASNREAYARFRQEAEIAASLNHAAIVQVFDFNNDPYGNPYMVMEFVEGETLDDFIRRKGKLTPREILGIFEPLCGALDAAHQAGIVHRDLKPSNVMVRERGSDGFAIKLLDFGISKIKHEGDKNMTRDNVVMGTPNYMSPEQAVGNNKDVDARTDIFALGAILYEMIAGKKAFDADALARLLHAIVYESPAKLTEIAPKVPPKVAEIVDRCLEKEAAKRFQSARVLMKTLRAAYRPDQPEAAKAAAAKAASGSSLLRRMGWTAAWLASVVGAAYAAATYAFDHAPSRPSVVEHVAPKLPPAARPERPAPEYPSDLVAPGARVLSVGEQLYRADLSGLSFWPDPGAEPRSHALPSASLVTSMAMSADHKSVLVGQGDGTVTEFDREVRGQTGVFRVLREPVVALTKASGYLAVASEREVHLSAVDTGKALRVFPQPVAPIAVLFVRGTEPRLLIVGPRNLEVIDADRRKSHGSVPLQSVALRAGVSSESADRPPEIWIDFAQGDWIVRREFRLVANGQDKPRLEALRQMKL